MVEIIEPKVTLLAHTEVMAEIEPDFVSLLEVLSPSGEDLNHLLDKAMEDYGE